VVIPVLKVFTSFILTVEISRALLAISVHTVLQLEYFSVIFCFTK
jgi:hypothetical protein